MTKSPEGVTSIKPERQIFQKWDNIATEAGLTKTLIILNNETPLNGTTQFEHDCTHYLAGLMLKWLKKYNPSFEGFSIFENQELTAGFNFIGEIFADIIQYFIQGCQVRYEQLNEDLIPKEYLIVEQNNFVDVKDKLANNIVTSIASSIDVSSNGRQVKDKVFLEYLVQKLNNVDLSQKLDRKEAAFRMINLQYEEIIKLLISNDQSKAENIYNEKYKYIIGVDYKFLYDNQERSRMIVNKGFVEFIKNLDEKITSELLFFRLPSSFINNEDLNNSIEKYLDNKEISPFLQLVINNCLLLEGFDVIKCISTYRNFSNLFLERLKDNPSVTNNNKIYYATSTEVGGFLANLTNIYFQNQIFNTTKIDYKYFTAIPNINESTESINERTNIMIKQLEAFFGKIDSRIADIKSELKICENLKDGISEKIAINSRELQDVTEKCSLRKSFEENNSKIQWLEKALKISLGIRVNKFYNPQVIEILSKMNRYYGVSSIE